MKRRTNEDRDRAICVIVRKCKAQNINITTIDLNRSAEKVLDIALSIGCDYQEKYLGKIVEAFFNTIVEKFSK
jgi:hypothetical protein